jgi:lipopolysaccharide export system permease protein
VINLGFFTFVFLMTRILEISDMVVNYRVSLVVVLQMFLFTTPFFLQFVIPMSVMMAVLLTFLQMSSDNEIVALKASGVSVYALIPPVLVFACIGMLLTGAIALYGLPHGRMAIKQLLYTIATTNTEIGLKERMFTDSFKGVMLYVNRIDPGEKTLYNIFIEDQRAADIVSTVVAPKGQLFNQPGVPVFHLRLYDGTINQVDLDTRSAHTVQFDTYDLRLNLEQVIPQALQGPKHVEEMSLTELRESIRQSSRRDDRYYMALMEFHKKFAMPFSCLALGILAIPLGIQSRMAKKSFGVGLGMAFFLMYYILLSVGWVFGETGAYPPLIGMWVPNLVMGGIGVALLRLTARERSVGIDRLVYAIRSLRQRFAARRTEGK